MKLWTAIIALSFLLLGCGKSESERLREQLELEKVKSELAALQQKRKDEDEAKEREAKDKREEKARAARAAAEAEENRRSEKNARSQAVTDLEVGLRKSMLDDGSKVVRLRNGSERTAEFTLKCYDNSGSYKKFPLVIAPNETKEIGFLEGWPGNFVPGESCEALYNNDKVWTISIK